ncbi:MAG: transcriptional regulator [Pyrinomonadaceae bacterium]
MGRRKSKEEHDEGSGLQIVESPAATSVELDKIIHERTRLGIISALAANERLSFADLKNLLDSTDGNLSVHARKLEDAGYIIAEKSFKDRKPLTEFLITKKGAAAIERYLAHMESIIAAVRGG